MPTWLRPTQVILWLAATASELENVPEGKPEAGKPKLPPVARLLVDRGLMRLDTSQRLPRLFFTEAGLVELRAMFADRRLADPKRFAHVRRELGIDPVSVTDPPQE